MIHVDEAALVCDLAETYHIFNYESLPPHLVATFACGLEDDSRIKRKLSGLKVPSNILLMATMIDSINALVWLNSEDGHRNTNRPKSIVDAILHPGEKHEEEIQSFDSGEEFEAYKREILRKGGFL